MPSKKRSVRRRQLARRSTVKRWIRKKRPDDRPILVNLVRIMCYRYGLAMAKFEFKGRIPKPSIDEFRERIVHHINLAESSLPEAFSKSTKRSLERARQMLSTRVRVDIDKIRNGINTEVEAVYDSLK